MKFAFRGGIHPAGRKELTQEAAPAVLAPRTVVLPMAQHLGAPCKPLVAVGDHVLVGQKIADGEGLCVPIHASVSGTVAAVEPRPHTTGAPVLAVVIDSDGRNEEADFSARILDPGTAAPEQIIAAVREAGIVGMGGATFPTGVKISSGLGKVDTVIVNGCECEPYITADDRLMRAHAPEILDGLRIVAAALRPKRLVFALEDNKPQALAALKKALGDKNDIELAALRTRYPQGAEKQLIQSVTGREVPGGKLPADVGCAVFNAATLFAVHEAVREGRPLTRRFVTVTGDGVEKPGNFLVPIGTPFADVIAAAGGLRACAEKVISGGPMMGVSQRDLAAPVIKGTNAVLCLAHEPIAVAHPTCIRCGKCVGVCPMRLEPLFLSAAVLHGELDKASALNLTDCIECGCCAYACPAKLPLVETFRAGKKALKERQAAKK